MRLTDYCKEHSYYTPVPFMFNSKEDTIMALCQKLGILEDLLEEFNINDINELRTCLENEQKGTEYFENWWNKRFKELLKPYKDLEVELEIDLKIYHKLMNMLYCGEPNILYLKDKDMIIQVGILEIDYCKKKLIFYKDKSYNDDYVCGFFQYGKTWALTKEELL